MARISCTFELALQVTWFPKNCTGPQKYYFIYIALYSRVFFFSGV